VLALAALPASRPYRLAHVYGRQFGRRCRSGLLVALTLEFGATTRANGHPAEAEDNSDHEHLHKNLICRHTPCFFISFDPWSDQERMLLRGPPSRGARRAAARTRSILVVSAEYANHQDWLQRYESAEVAGPPRGCSTVIIPAIDFISEPAAL
jgi:hypothetical protein